MDRKVITILGARPQFVKAAAVSRAISQANQGSGKQLVEKIVHTGQHFDHKMSDIFFEQMQIPKPDFRLELGGLSQGAMTGRMIEQLEALFITENPDAVMVYGDTNSTIAGAMAAVKLHIPIIHVEAGLRSFNMAMPEEVNRILTDRISSWLFCPTEAAMSNLRQEGFGVDDSSKRPHICNVGDVMYDAALFYSDQAIPSVELEASVGGFEQFYLVTLHRQENTDDLSRLKSIFSALSAICRLTPVVLPLHPRTQKMLKSHEVDTGDVLIIEPVAYFDMLYLLKSCSAVLTDSGGLQKEAYFFQKPCITMRDQTEWVELVESGCNTLVGADTDKIIEAVDALTGKQFDFSHALYGDGQASTKLVEKLIESL